MQLRGLWSFKNIAILAKYSTFRENSYYVTVTWKPKILGKTQLYIKSLKRKILLRLAPDTYYTAEEFGKKATCRYQTNSI